MIDKKAITKLQVLLIAAIIVIAGVAGVAYYAVTLNKGSGKVFTVVDTSPNSGTMGFKPAMESWLNARGYTLQTEFISEEVIKDKLMVAFMTNKTDFDMFIGYPSGFRPFVPLGVLMDVTSYIPQWIKDMPVVDKTYSEQTADLKGHYFTFPLAGCGCDFYVYRVDVWDALGLQHPDNVTWDQFYNDLEVVATAIKDNSLSGKVSNVPQYAFSPLGLPWGCGHWTYWQKLLADGGQWIYDNGSSAVNSPAGLTALEQMREMYVSPPDLPNLVAPYAMSAWTELRDQMAAGNLAATAWSDEKWAKTFEDSTKTLPSLIGKIKVITPPGGPDGHVLLNSGVGYAVVAKSPNAEIAAELCQYLLTDPVQQGLINTPPYSMPQKTEQITSAAARTMWGDNVVDTTLFNINQKLPTAEAVCDQYFMEEVNAQVPIFRSYMTGQINATTCLALLESTSNQIRGIG